MNREEFKKIVSAIKSVYPKFGIVDKEQFDFWFSMLNDIDYGHMQLTVQKYVSEEKWPPTIADLRKSYTESTQTKILDVNEAWGEVQKAIRSYGSYQEVKAIESMSETTASVVKNMNYKELCLSENQMADRSHFMKMYNTYSERTQKQAQLPPAVAQQLEDTISANALGLSMPEYKVANAEQTRYVSYKDEDGFNL